MSTHQFFDLSSVIDEVHGLFDTWAEAGTLRPALDQDGEIVLRLAVHEWIANLVQHAAFVERAPEISLQVEVEDASVRVVVEDTSRGFDLLGQLEAQSTLLDAPAPSERGRGLLMLITCTHDLDYRPAREDRQRLSFRLANPGDGVFAGLFRSADFESLDLEPALLPLDDLVDGLPSDGFAFGDGSSPTSPSPSSR
ncbi:MAG: ATP-binding protein [Bacteroidota bacterium]